MLGLFVTAAWLIGLQGSSIQTVSFQKGLWNPVRSRCAQGRAASPTRGGSWNPRFPLGGSSLPHWDRTAFCTGNTTTARWRQDLH